MVRTLRESRGKKRGRPRNDRSRGRPAEREEDENIVICISSDSMSPNTSASYDESINTVANSSAARSWVRNRGLPQCQVLLTNIAHERGILNSRHRKVLANSRRGVAKRLKRLEKRLKKRQTIISLLSSSPSISAEFDGIRSDVKENDRSIKSKGDSQTVKEEPESDGIIDLSGIESTSVTSFGVHSSRVSPRQGIDTTIVKKEESTSNNTGSFESNGSMRVGTRKRGRPKKFSPSDHKSQRLGQRGISRNARRSIEYSDERIAVIREQLASSLGVINESCGAEDSNANLADRSRLDGSSGRGDTASSAQNVVSDDENVAASQIGAEEIPVVKDVENPCDGFPASANGKLKTENLTANGDLRAGVYSGLQFFMGPGSNDKIASLLDNRNEPTTGLAASVADVDHVLDKEVCTLESISRAIDHDAVLGGALFTSMDTPVMMNMLPQSLSDDDDISIEKAQERPDPPARSRESFDPALASGHSAAASINGNESCENSSKQANKNATTPTPLSEEIVRENRKKRKRSIASAVTDDNINSLDSNVTTMGADEKKNPAQRWEFSELLNCHCNTRGTYCKEDLITEDALNNNKEIAVVDEIDSRQERNAVTLSNAASSATPQKPPSDMNTEADALESLLVGMEPGNLFDITIEDSINIEILNASMTEASKNTGGEGAMLVEKLTVRNLKKFNNSVDDRTTAVGASSLAGGQTNGSDASLHRTKAITESSQNRKRKWITTVGEPSPTSSGKIKLQRRKWSSESPDEQSAIAKQAKRETAPVVDQAMDLSVRSKAATDEKVPIADEKDIDETPFIAETVAMINKASRKILSPTTPARGNSHVTEGLTSEFGGSNRFNIVTSTPTRSGVAPAIKDDIDGSSSSSSDSDSDSDSGSSSSDDDPEDGNGTPEKAVEIKENQDEVVSTRRAEGSCQSDSGITSATQMQMSQKPMNQEEEEDDMDLSLGSPIPNDDDERQSEDKDSDAISLDTESLNCSRAASPVPGEPSQLLQPAASPEKPTKPGNVRSRLGPRVTVETKKSAPSGIQILSVVDSPAGSVIDSPAGLQALVNPNSYFLGHCFAWLRKNECRHRDQCNFKHDVLPALRYHILNNTPQRSGIIHHAMEQKFHHFLVKTQHELMAGMTARAVIYFCIDLAQFGILDEVLLMCAIRALKQHGLRLLEIINLFEVSMKDNQADAAMRIVGSLHRLLEPGSYWESIKKMIAKFATPNPPLRVLVCVLHECVTLLKNKPHVDDVYDNLVCRLSDDTVLALGRSEGSKDLLKEFYELRNSLNAVVAIAPPAEPAKDVNFTCSIASPDSPRASEESPLPPQTESRSAALSLITVSQSTSSGRGNREETKYEESSTPSGSSTQYRMQPVDNLPLPKSPASDWLWKFHMDLQGVQEGLARNDYDHVIEILQNLQNNPNRLPHIAGFYNILRREIMTSGHHLDQIVRRTVQSGASIELRRFVYDLGILILTTLADCGYWILGHELLKTLSIFYGPHNNCASTLLSAEIYIATRRPLKALFLLRQSGLTFTSPRKWNQFWCADDLPLRNSVINLLLTSLCDEHVEYALKLLEFLLRDQCSSANPIHIGRHADSVARALLKEEKSSDIVDLGRLILANNLMVRPKTFRAMVNSIFHSDYNLAKHLHHYAMWLGVYSMPEINMVTHLIVNVDWTEEEMFLMFSSLLYELYINIGHAIGRLKPRQLRAFLIIEDVALEEQLNTDAVLPPLTNREINIRRAKVKKVLHRFDPKINLIKKVQGKLCKINSASLVNYLKAGHFKK